MELLSRDEQLTGKEHKTLLSLHEFCFAAIVRHRLCHSSSYFGLIKIWERGYCYNAIDMNKYGQLMMRPYIFFFQLPSPFSALKITVYRRTDGRTDGRTHPLEEMRGCS